MAQKGMFLVFLDGERNVLFEKKLTSLPVKEKCIVEKSIEFFHDPEPCIIHRTAVMKRIYAEAEDYLANQLQVGLSEHSWDSVPEICRKNFDIDGRTIYIKVTIIC